MVRDDLDELFAGFKMATNIVQDAMECCVGMLKGIP